MDRHVEIRLSTMDNDTETLFDFIRDSEKEFGIEQKCFEGMTVKQLDEYIEFLDNLWNK
jgi:hypothetical protein